MATTLHSKHRFIEEFVYNNGVSMRPMSNLLLVFNQVVPMVSDLVTLLLKLMMTGTVMRKQ